MNRGTAIDMIRYADSQMRSGRTVFIKRGRYVHICYLGDPKLNHGIGLIMDLMEMQIPTPKELKESFAIVREREYGEFCYQLILDIKRKP